MGMRYAPFLVLVLTFITVSCATKESEVFVSSYHLKDTELVTREGEIVRAEQQKYLRGAVEQVDQDARMGLYYTAEWKLSEDVVGSPEKVVFYYRQAATGDKVLKQVQEVAPQKRRGVCEFKVIGDSYQTGGRVLAWRAELHVGGKIQAYEQSYLWE